MMTKAVWLLSVASLRRSFGFCQLRRSIRKKHTLPYYKIRYKPFFTKPEADVATPDMYCSGRKLSVGQLAVTVIGCSRLFKLPADATVYCTLALGKVHPIVCLLHVSAR